MNRLGKTIKYLLRTNIKIYLISVASAYLAGIIILFIIMALSGEDDFITLGSFFGKIMMYVLALFMTVGYYTNRFHELVKLGTSRKTSMLAVTLASLGVPILLEFVFVLLIKIERFLMKFCFRITKEYKFFNIADRDLLYFGLVLILIIYLLGIIASVCINKFGHNGFIAIYFIYSALFYLPPQAFGKLVVQFEIFAKALDFILQNPVPSVAAAAAVYLTVYCFLVKSVYKTAI